MAFQIHEAVGVLRQVTDSADGTKVVVRLDLGQVELQFASSHQNNLRAKLRRDVDNKIALLWYNATNGDQVVKIRQLDKNPKSTVAHCPLSYETPKRLRKTKQKPR